MSNQINVVNNPQALRFEVALNGELATIEYRYYKNDMAFMHTQVPDAFKGKGIAGAMAKVALQFAIDHKKKIMLYCPFVSRYVKEHPEYHYLVDTAFHPSFAK